MIKHKLGNRLLPLHDTPTGQVAYTLGAIPTQMEVGVVGIRQHSISGTHPATANGLAAARAEALKAVGFAGAAAPGTEADFHEGNWRVAQAHAMRAHRRVASIPSPRQSMDISLNSLEMNSIISTESASPADKGLQEGEEHGGPSKLLATNLTRSFYLRQRQLQNALLMRKPSFSVSLGQSSHNAATDASHSTATPTLTGGQIVKSRDPSPSGSVIKGVTPTPQQLRSTTLTGNEAIVGITLSANARKAEADKDLR